MFPRSILLPDPAAAADRRDHRGILRRKWLKGKSHWPIWIGVGFARDAVDLVCCSQMLEAVARTAATKRSTGGQQSTSTGSTAGQVSSLTAGYFFDPLTAVMLCVVCGIGFFITVFAAGYMKGEEGYFRFFAYLGLFIFMMTIPGDGREPHHALPGLGRRGPLLVSADRLLLRKARPRARRRRRRFWSTASAISGSAWGSCCAFLAFGTVSYFGDGVGTHTGLLELAAEPADLTAFQQHGAEVDSVPADARRVRQIGAVPAVCLAARCDGRPDAGQRADPRGHDGDRRRLHDRPLRHAVRRQRRGDDDDRRRRRVHRALRRDHRAAAVRSEESLRLFDRSASLASCSSASACWRRSRACFIWSRTRSSRRCCSSAPAW